MSQGELRRRRVSGSKSEDASSRTLEDKGKKPEEVVWGKTPSGEGTYQTSFMQQQKGINVVCYSVQGAYDA